MTYSRREGFLRCSRELDDQDRPLTNVWEGMNGLMEHVSQKFPMPQKVSEQCKLESSSKQRDLSKGSKCPQRNFERESRSMKDKREKMFCLNNQGKSESASILSGITKFDSKTTEFGLIKNHVSNGNNNIIENGRNSPLVSLKFEEKPTKDYDMDEEREEESFVVLDSCGEVDVDMDDIAQVFEDNDDDHQVEVDNLSSEMQDLDDLMLAFTTGDGKETVYQDSPAALFDSPIALPTLTVSKSSAVIINSNAKQDSKKLSEPKRIFYKPHSASVGEAETVKRNIQEKFTIFDKALKVLCTRFHTIKSCFLKKSRMKEIIEDSDFHKVSELGCLAVSLFSEMEVFRLTLNPTNTQKMFRIPATYQLSEEDKKIFLDWYSFISQRLEQLMMQFANLFEDYLTEILDFNDRVKNIGGIKIPDLLYFSQDQRFSRFCAGSLQVYQVSAHLMEFREYINDILSSACRELLRGPGTLYSELVLKTTSMSAKQGSQKSSVPQRISYEPCPDSAIDGDVVKKDLQRNFNAFDVAMNTLGKRMHSIQSNFSMKSRVKENIVDSDLFKVSELGCLAVALFSEMEVLRLNHNPLNTKKQFISPATCVLTTRQKEDFLLWYRNLTKKLEKLKLQFAKLMKDYPIQILEFNDRVGFKGGIRIPGIHFFTKCQRFSRFQRGTLKVYKVSTLLKEPIDYKDDFVSPSGRHVLWKPGTLYSEQALKTKSKFCKGENMQAGEVKDSSIIPNAESQMLEANDFQHIGPQIRDDKSPGPILHMKESVVQTHEGSTNKKAEHPVGVQNINNKDSLGRNVSKDVNVSDSHCMDDALSHSQAPNMEIEKTSTYYQIIQANDEIPDSHKNNPGFLTDTFHHLNEMIEKWKRDQKYIRKRLFFLSNKLTKEKTDEGLIKVCIELAKHGKTIESINIQFEAERTIYSEASYKSVKFQFSPSVLSHIGQVVANHLIEKMNQFELNLRLLHQSFKKVFFTNLKTIEHFNRSDAAKQNGRVILPKKLDTLRNCPLKTGSVFNSEPNMRCTEGKGEHHQRPSSGCDVQRRKIGASHLSMQHQSFYNEGSGKLSLQGNEDGNGFQNYLECRETISSSKSIMGTDLLHFPSYDKDLIRNHQFCSQQNQHAFYNSSEFCSQSFNYAPFDSANSGHSLFQTVERNVVPKECSQKDDGGPFYHEQGVQNFNQPDSGNCINHLTENEWQSGYWSEYDKYTYNPCSNENPHGSFSNRGLASTKNQSRSYFGMQHYISDSNFTAHKNVAGISKSGTMSSAILSTQRTSHFNKISPPSVGTGGSDFQSWSHSDLNFSSQSHQALADRETHTNSSYENPPLVILPMKHGLPMPGPSHFSAEPVTLPSCRNASFTPRLEDSLNSLSFPPMMDNLGPGQDTPSKIPLQSDDPADGLNIKCHCNCGGKMLKGIPTMLDHRLNISPKTRHWLKLSLLFNDIAKVTQMQCESFTWFDKLTKHWHRKAANRYLDINATLPHLAAIMKRLRQDHQQRGFLEEMPYDDVDLKSLGVAGFKGNSLEAVENALLKLYVKHNELYKERKAVILRFHYHAEAFISIRNCVYKLNDERDIFKSPSKNKKTKVLKNLGVFP